MPASYQINSKLNLVYVRYVGVVSAEESVDNFLAYLMSGDAKPGRSVLVDFSECTQMLISFSDMVSLIGEKLGLLDPYEATMVTAMFAPDDTIRAQCLEYQRLVSNSDKQMVGVFDDLTQAYAFLNIDMSDVPHGFEGA
ncbi:hypothetical protein ACS3SW_04375 [Roseobacteraceae bacterium S113]